MKSFQNRYNQRGVSSSKDEVHKIVDHMDRGIFPGAFCKITEDLLTGNENLCNVIHSDGAGTKSILAYLWYRETGDPKIFHGIAQDSIVMNLDDLACVGIWDRIVLSSTVNRNARNFPGEALGALINGTEEFLENLRSLGINVESGGGETADVGDLTGTVTVDSCAVAVAERNKVVDNNKIVPGLAIVGFSSTGRTNYEAIENSGIGSNGLTSARHELLSKHYSETFPETFDPETNPDFIYCGPYRMLDSLPESDFSVGEALLSPTRTYLPIAKKIMEENGEQIHGLVHCSGGGQTKCLRFGNQVHHIKNDLFEPPPLFREIQKVSQTSDEEMHQVYNMGHRFEAYCQPEAVDSLISVGSSFGLETKVVGFTEESKKEDKSNHLDIILQDKTLSYGI